MGKSGSKGFTLIELMIVIAIIAVLSIIGITIFNGLQKGGRDSRRKEDVLSISKAYEKNYNNGSKYLSLATTDFSQGVIPKDPSGSDYFNVVANDGSGYKVCAALDVNSSRVCNTPSTNCYCLLASQSNFSSSTNNNTITGTNSSIGLGFSSSSCDPNGTLGSGLVGYWKMDEGTGTTTADSSGSGNTGNLVNNPSWAGASAKLGNALTFNGTSNYVGITSLSPNAFPNITLAAWIYATAVPPVGKTARAAIVAASDAWIGIDEKGNLTSNLWDGTKNSTLSTSGNNYLNQWALVVMTADGSRETLYVNNYLVTYMAAGNMNWESSTEAGIAGTNSLPPAFYFTGIVDDVRIYNRVLSTSELNTLWNSGIGCPS